MNRHYKDILSRISERPLWWDEHAVPRFITFHPDKIADIYAREAVLLRIDCQYCNREFDVALSHNEMDKIRAMQMDVEFVSLADEIANETIHYGDPPNIECCAAGPTMSSNPRKVLQYWEREGMVWTRHPILEVEFRS